MGDRSRLQSRQEAILTGVGLLVWLSVSATSVVRALTVERLLWFVMASAFFALAFWASQTRARHERSLIAVQSAAVIAMTGILCNGYEGFLLALVASQLAARESARVATAWIVLQTLALGLMVAFEWNTRSALLLAPPYFAFQILAFTLARQFHAERNLRVELETAHRHALTLQDQLSRMSRVDERLRMSQDLHDVLGHRLTALSLNLEAAAHHTGNAHGFLSTAQALVRTLLGDVKQLVMTYKDEEPVDLVAELCLLTRDLPGLEVDVQCPDTLSITDPVVGRALLRCAQECVTNSIRHGAASRIWIELDADPEALSMRLRDDGVGGRAFHDGMGIAGMRRRIQELGGVFEVQADDTGFRILARLPVTGARAA